MKSSRIVFPIIAVIAIVQTGCLALTTATAVGGGVAGVAYVRGRCTETMSANIDDTADATLAALQDVGMPADKHRIGRTYGEIDSWTPDRHPLMIDLESVPGKSADEPPQTKVGIRFGPFGDKAQSERIIAQIMYRLENPPAPQPAAPLQPSAKQSDEPPLAK